MSTANTSLYIIGMETEDYILDSELPWKCVVCGEELNEDSTCPTGCVKVSLTSEI